MSTALLELTLTVLFVKPKNNRKTGENPVFSPVLWQGQKDLSRLPPRVLLPSGERPAPTEAAVETGSRQSATGDQRPSARGFGVDVGERSKEGGRNGVGRFLAQGRKQEVLVWCCREF